MPKVSVVIPVYGVEKFIERCARSLFEQTLQDVEFIFVDDCTPDRSVEVLREVLAEYQSRIPRTRIERMPTNSGLPTVRRHGVQFATGDYIIHCDSDDWVEKDWLEKLYAKAAAENLDVCICDYRRATDDSFEEGVKCFYEDEDCLTSLLRCRITGAVWNKLVRREFYQSPDFIWPTMNFNEDYVCSFQIVTKAARIGYVPEPLYNYYRNSQSIVAGSTRAKVLEKQRQNIANYKIVEGLYNICSRNAEYRDAFLTYKLAVKNGIRPYVKDPEILRFWRRTFPGLGLEIWHSRYITLRMRIAYISTYIGMFPLFSHTKEFEDA